MKTQPRPMGEVEIEEVQEFRNPLRNFPSVAVVFPLSGLPHRKCVTQPDLHTTISSLFVGVFFLLKRASLQKEASQGNPVCSSVPVVIYLLTKDGAEHTKIKYNPIYIVSDLNHSASPSCVCMQQHLRVRCSFEMLFCTHTTRIHALLFR